MTVQVSAMIDHETKLQFDHLCKTIGASPSSTIVMLIREAIKSMKGNIRSADELAAPLEDFSTLKSPLPEKERRAIVDSLIGTIDDFPLIEPLSAQHDSLRVWELMDA